MADEKAKIVTDATRAGHSDFIVFHSSILPH